MPVNDADRLNGFLDLYWKNHCVALPELLSGSFRPNLFHFRQPCRGYKYFNKQETFVH